MVVAVDERHCAVAGVGRGSAVGVAGSLLVARLGSLLGAIAFDLVLGTCHTCS